MKPEELTIKQLLSSLGQLGVGQIVSIVSVIIGVCSFIFYAGTWYGNAEISEKKSEIAALNLQLEGYRQSEIWLQKQKEELMKQIDSAKSELDNVNFKERFMSLYINYLIEDKAGKTKIPNSISENSFSPIDASGLANQVSEGTNSLSKFAKFIDKLVDSKEVTLKKGGPSEGSFVFFKDGTKWEVPLEVMNRTMYYPAPPKNRFER